MLRPLAVLALAVVALVVAPAIAQAHEDEFDPQAACPVEAPQAEAEDRGRVPAEHARNVDCAAFLDIAVGTPDDVLHPDRRVRRDQMASVVARTLEAAGVALPDPEEGRAFTDVSADSPHADSIRRLQAAGVVRGGPGERSADEYGPALPMRRDQLAAVLSRARGYAFDEDVAGGGSSFGDVPEGNVHASAIGAAADVGLAVGSQSGAFAPASPARRDQTASAAARLATALATPASVELQKGSSGPAEVSETRTVTATVFSQFRDAAGEEARWTSGEPVTFSAEHERASSAVTPAESRTVAAGPSGEAAFQFAAIETGTVTVTAAISGPGGNFRHAGGDQDRVVQEVRTGEPTEEAAPETETAPEAAPETETAPEAAPETETAPEAAPETETAPEAAPESETAPEAAPESETAPEAAPETETAPEAAPETAPSETAPSEEVTEEVKEEVKLVPEEATNEAPGEHTVRATLIEDGQQARGRAIRFEVYREGDDTFALSEEPDAAPRADVTATGLNGEPATFTYAFDRELEDDERVEHLVVACEARGDNPCVSIISGDYTERPHDTAVKTWVPAGS